MEAKMLCEFEHQQKLYKMKHGEKWQKINNQCVEWATEQFKLPNVHVPGVHEEMINKKKHTVEEIIVENFSNLMKTANSADLKSSNNQQQA